MPSREYLAHPGMNQSKLKNILFGVEQFKEYSTKPRKPSPEQALGSAVHLLTFEPDLRDNIIVLPKIDERTNKGKVFALLQDGKTPDYFEASDKKGKKKNESELYQVSLEDHDYMLEVYAKYADIFKTPQDYIFLSDNQLSVAHKMSEALHNNEDFQMLKSNCTQFESTHFFNYKGIDFKAQTDGRGVLNNNQFILDLKTSSMFPMPDDEDQFRYDMWKQITKDYYHFQAACYLRTVEPDFFYDGVPKYYIVYVRSISPYQVYLVELSEEMLLKGKELFDKACDKYLKCLVDNPEFIGQNKIRKV